MEFVHIFLQDFRQGGLLMPIIFIVAIISWSIGIKKMTTLSQISSARKQFLKNALSIIDDAAPTANPHTTGLEQYDILLGQIRRSVSENAKGSKGFMREFLIATVPVLERDFSTMSTWISTAPLLGLLGTVIGMIQTFRVIMDFGIGNPALTAEGISVALLTTQAGLTAAFPAMIFHNYLINRKDALVGLMLKDCDSLVNSLTTSTTQKGRSLHV